MELSAESESESETFSIGGSDVSDIRFPRSLTGGRDRNVGTSDFGSQTIGSVETTVLKKSSLTVSDNKVKKRSSHLEEPPSEAPPPRPGTFLLYIPHFLNALFQTVHFDIIPFFIERGCS